MNNETREVIFEMPLTYGRYRVVCQFGMHYLVDYAWWGYLQREITYKRWPWSKKKFKWYEIDRCWWSTEVTTMEQLQKNATDFYDQNVELPIRIRQKAMSL